MIAWAHGAANHCPMGRGISRRRGERVTFSTGGAESYGNLPRFPGRFPRGGRRHLCRVQGELIPARDRPRVRLSHFVEKALLVNCLNSGSFCGAPGREVRDAGGDHGALGLVEVTPVEVEGDNEVEQVGFAALVGAELRLDPGQLARPIAVAAASGIPSGLDLAVEIEVLPGPADHPDHEGADMLRLPRTRPVAEHLLDVALRGRHAAEGVSDQSGNVVATVQRLADGGDGLSGNGVSHGWAPLVVSGLAGAGGRRKETLRPRCQRGFY
jgi:hypothetical protein